jgi:hypothetical protein
MSGQAAHSSGVYTFEKDTVGEQQWNALLEKFEDANLQQTWGYGSIRWGEKNLSRILLYRNREIAAAAQVVIKAVPLLGGGIARVRGGPCWQLWGKDKDPDALRHMLRALREVFVIRRGLLLQIFPAAFEDGSETIRRVFEEEGFEIGPDGDPNTALIDLSSPLDDVRQNLKRALRRNLKQAERGGLTVSHGTSQELLMTVGRLYIEGLRRRRLAPVMNIEQLKDTQGRLPESQKMRLMVCAYQGRVVAGIAVPFLGNTAQVLISGTGNDGVKFCGSYLLHWRMMEWLKERGCRWYDLGGVNPAVRSGDSYFKLGFAGHKGMLPERLGRFEAFDRKKIQIVARASLHFRKAYTGMRAAISGRAPIPIFKTTQVTGPRQR